MSEAAAAARRALEAAGTLPDEEIDLATTALHFARIDRPDLDWQAGQGFVSRLVAEAVAIRVGLSDTAGWVAALSRLLHGVHGFSGDRETYDDPANANLLAVLERRRGLPVALGLIWLHLGEAAGVECHGLDTPGHFLMAFGPARARLVCDPFDAGRLVQHRRADGALRAAAMTKRAVLLRLQNNIRVRRLRAGEEERALACVLDMLRLAPDAAPLWLEAALLQQRGGDAAAALASLDRLAALPRLDPALAADAAALRRRLGGGPAPLRGSGDGPFQRP